MKTTFFAFFAFLFKTHDSELKILQRVKAWKKFKQRVKFWKKNFHNMSAFELKFSQRVRFWTEILTMCYIMN